MKIPCLFIILVRCMPKKLSPYCSIMVVVEFSLSLPLVRRGTARLVHTLTIRVLWISGVGEERTPIHGVAGCGWRRDHIVVRGIQI